MPSSAEYGRAGQSSRRESRQELRQESKRESRSRFWLSIARIAVCEVVLLVALSGAAVAYLNWSSQVAFAQFLNPPGPSAQPIKSVPPCDRGA